MSDRLICPPREALVTVLYGEGTVEERRELDAHLAACAPCRDEYETLGGLRLALGEWHAPAPPEHVRVVIDPGRQPAAPPAVVPGPARWWTSRTAVRAALAAAATLVLGASAGLANLDVTLGPDGLRVRTGRAQTAVAQTAPEAPPQPAAAPATDAQEPDSTAWRAELAALEQRLRTEMSSRGEAAATQTVAAAPAPRGDDTAFMRRVQELIDAAETRQQRNLALRMTELAREFDVQRRTDLVTFQQGLGQLEGRTQAEVARTREMMNYIVRASSNPPQR